MIKPNLRNINMLKMFRVVGTKAPENVPSFDDDGAGRFVEFGSAFGSIPPVLPDGGTGDVVASGMLNPFQKVLRSRKQTPCFWSEGRTRFLTIEPETCNQRHETGGGGHCGSTYVGVVQVVNKVGVHKTQPG
jgi:hypothetical protein